MQEVDARLAHRRELRVVLRDAHVDESGRTFTLLHVPGDEREPELGRGGNVERIAASDTKAGRDPGSCAGERIVHRNEAQAWQSEDGVHRAPRQARHARSARHGPGHLWQE